MILFVFLIICRISKKILLILINGQKKIYNLITKTKCYNKLETFYFYFLNMETSMLKEYINIYIVKKI